MDIQAQCTHNFYTNIILVVLGIDKYKIGTVKVEIQKVQEIRQFYDKEKNTT